jgi:hypothetical protein
VPGEIYTRTSGPDFLCDRVAGQCGKLLELLCTSRACRVIAWAITNFSYLFMVFRTDIGKKIVAILLDCR